MISQNQNKSNPLQERRVAVVVYSHYPSDPRPRRAAEALASQGMKVEVLCLKNDMNEPSRDVSNGIEILRLPIKHRRGGKVGYVTQYVSFLISCFFVLSWRCFFRRYSLVHVHNMPDILAFSAIVPRLLGARVILDLHDPMPELMMSIFGLAENSKSVRVLKFLEKMSIRAVDAVITVNEACRKIFSSRSCSAEKVHVVMNSPDEAIFAAPADHGSSESCGDHQTRFVIMYHGSIVERHGLDLVVRALSRVRKSAPHVELRIYGETNAFLKKVMAEVRKLGMEDCVHWEGKKDLKEIADAIQICDLGIIPNRRSIFTEINTPTRIFEYLSQGKPVLAPDSGGITDYFGPDDLVFFKLGDQADLEAKLAFAVTHPVEIQKTASNGGRVYLAHKWENERRRFVGLVEGLVAPRLPGGSKTTAVASVAGENG